LSLDIFPPNMRKHLDPQSPVPLRMMAAKMLVRLSPSDMLAALYMLSFDPDPAVRATAAKTASELPDRVLAPAIRDESTKPPALAYFLALYAETTTCAEMLVLNASTPDKAIAQLAADCSSQLAEIIAQNQLRLLRHEDLVRQLCRNPNASRALIDGVCDFAVRSGLLLPDVPKMNEARIRVYGPEAISKPPERGPSADEIMREYQELADDSAPPMEERKRLTLAQRVMKMSIAEKIKLATIGSKEARGLLIRDTNKLVALAVIRSPRITDGEILHIARNRTVIDDVLRIIYNNREWTKMYPVKVALVKNPKTPLAIAMKYLTTLRESEVKELARDRNIPSAVQLSAKKQLDKKDAPKRES
jgi:arsenate reductase-like glutaredoxin family protein